ncbi:hypothetical protein VNO77_19500 [Canavalia gladiata]|uniref:Uncharacterized protein n=1 Tax=Canavalia gladiata TaxID=3824 RepID=A0AAN9LMW1_CANGL
MNCNRDERTATETTKCNSDILQSTRFDLFNAPNISFLNQIRNTQIQNTAPFERSVGVNSQFMQKSSHYLD